MSENLQIQHPNLVFQIGCRGFGNETQVYHVLAKDWEDALQIFKREMPDANPVMVQIKSDSNVIQIN